MGYIHKIDAQRGVATVQLGGVVTGQEFTEVCSSLFLDKKWSPQLNHIWDARSVDRFNFNKTDVEAAKLLIDTFKGQDDLVKGRIAVVISGRVSDFLADVGHIIMQLCTRPISFFAEVEEAESWIAKP